MGWQILHLSQQAHLSLKHGQCAVDFAAGDSISLPLDNLSIVVLESLHITLSAALLQKMAANGIAVFVCNETHTSSLYKFSPCSFYKICISKATATTPLATATCLTFYKICISKATATEPKQFG